MTLSDIFVKAHVSIIHYGAFYMSKCNLQTSHLRRDGQVKPLILQMSISYIQGTRTNNVVRWYRDGPINLNVFLRSCLGYKWFLTILLQIGGFLTSPVGIIANDKTIIVIIRNKTNNNPLFFYPNHCFACLYWMDMIWVWENFLIHDKYAYVVNSWIDITEILTFLSMLSLLTVEL